MSRRSRLRTSVPASLTRPVKATPPAGLPALTALLLCAHVLEPSVRDRVVSTYRREPVGRTSFASTQPPHRAGRRAAWSDDHGGTGPPVDLGRVWRALGNVHPERHPVASPRNS
jgi:hypothetical protein